MLGNNLFCILRVMEIKEKIELRSGKLWKNYGKARKLFYDFWCKQMEWMACVVIYLDFWRKLDFMKKIENKGNLKKNH